jgi:hypothetical protein
MFLHDYDTHTILVMSKAEREEWERIMRRGLNTYPIPPVRDKWSDLVERGESD